MKLKFSIFILSALVFMTSCVSTIRHNLIAQVDNSRTISEATLNKYISTLQLNILQNMGRYDRLEIQFIDECSLTKAERVFSLDLAAMEFSNKADGMNNAENFTKERMKKFLADSISSILKTIIIAKREERKDCGNFTDIINALNEATSLLIHKKSYKNTVEMILNAVQGKDNYEYENSVIIFSDMVNENREKTFDFTEFGKCDEEMINNKLEALHKLNKIPDLSGCKILIYGATSTVTDIYANKQIENCKIRARKKYSIFGALLRDAVSGSGVC